MLDKDKLSAIQSVFGNRSDQAKYFFFRSMKDRSGEMHLFSLPFQTLYDGSPMQKDLLVDAFGDGKTAWEVYPEGSVFCSVFCDEKTSGGRTLCYEAGALCPVSSDALAISEGLPMPTQEMVDAYADYVKLVRARSMYGRFSEMLVPGLQKRRTV